MFFMIDNRVVLKSVWNVELTSYHINAVCSEHGTYSTAYQCCLFRTWSLQYSISMKSVWNMELTVQHINEACLEHGTYSTAYQ